MPSARPPHALARRTFVAAALVAPLAVPAFVNAYAWVSLRPSLTGLGGAALITTLSYTPFVFLPVAALLRGLDSRWEDSARSLGLGGGAPFRRVVLPLIGPSVVTGMVLVALAVGTELTATLLLAPTGTDTLALAFWREASELDYAAAAPYAAVMVALSAPLTILLRRQIVEVP